MIINYSIGETIDAVEFAPSDQLQVVGGCVDCERGIASNPKEFISRFPATVIERESPEPTCNASNVSLSVGSPRETRGSLR